MIPGFLNRHLMLVFLATIICSSIITIGYAYAGEFPTPKQGEEKEPEEEQEPKGQEEVPPVEGPQGKGGCLIATAAHGTELALQVQQLREIREKVLLTNSGTAFLNSFNDIYYSFSPTVADWERQNSAFKELVRITITPMLTTLAILNHVEIDSEQEMLGYGIGIILLNIGMYFVAPAFAVLGLRKFVRR